MAPEQLKGAEADVRTDVYGAGAVLYEMATGSRAFPERQEAQLFDAVLRRAVVAPRELRPGLSAPLEGCILKALEKDPGQRYQTATDLSRDLGAVPQATTATPPPTRPRRIGFIPVAAALVTIALGGVAVRPYLVRLVGVQHSELPSRAAAPSTAAPTTAAAPLLLAVVPPQNLTNQPKVDAWLPLVRSLFTAELTGVRDLGVINL